MKHRKTNHVINNYHWLLLGLLFIVLMPIVACSVPQSNSQETESPLPAASLPTTTTATTISPSATIVPSVTRTQTSTATPSPSATPTATATITPFPSATSTSTFTPAPTLTPLPTIPPQQRGQVYSQLMSSNGGCLLPCWWGFEPGVTSLDEVRQFYTALGAYTTEQIGRNGISALYATFVDPQIEDGIQISHSFLAQDGIVIEPLVHADGPNYHIKSLLQQLGPPSNVWMWTIPEPYQGILPTRFRLYFPEQGVFVLYATGGERVDEAVQVCFDGPGGTTLLLWDPAIWDPDGTKSIIDRSDDGGTAFTLEGYPIEDVSNWDAEQFYTALTDPTRSECLKTSSNLWPPP